MINEMILWSIFGAVIAALALLGLHPSSSQKSKELLVEAYIKRLMIFFSSLILLFYLVIFTIEYLGYRKIYFFLVYPGLLYFLIIRGLRNISHLASAQYAFLCIASLSLFLFYFCAFNSDAIQLAEGRFLNGWLASDNTLPWIFAKGILTQSGTDFPVPLFADWMPGDRPPAYTAALLLPLSIFFGHNPSGSYFEYLVPIYTSASIVFNNLYLLPVYLILRQKFPDFETFIICLILLVLPALLINTVYAWPKNFSMFFILCAIYFLAKNNLFFSSLGCVLAFLSHGNSVFLVAALGFLLVHQHRFSAIKSILLNSLLWLPWVSIQKFVFPPGDRLLKYHLADQQSLTDIGFLDTLAVKYADLTFKDYIFFKLNNLCGIFGLSCNRGDLSLLSDDFGWLQFFGIIPSLTPLILGLLFARLVAQQIVRLRGMDGVSQNANPNLEPKESLWVTYQKISLFAIFWSSVLAVLILFGGDDSKLTLVTVNMAIIPLAFILLLSLVSSRAELLLCLAFVSFLSFASIYILGPPDKEFTITVPSLVYLGIAIYLFKLYRSKNLG